jgi:hypothetical protein
MTRTIIQKGVAGLGDRLMTLGWCLQLADKKRAHVYPHWLDTSWREGFFTYFRRTDTILDVVSLDGAIEPREAWSIDNALCISGREEIGYENIRRIPTRQAVDREWDIYVVLTYSGWHIPTAERLLKELRLKHWIKADAKKAIEKLPANYSCKHLRFTDKANANAREFLRSVKPGEVLITDSITAKKVAIENGAICPSLLPEATPRHGVHHMTEEQAGISKHDLNAGAIVDMLIGINAAEFEANDCTSNFGRIINQARKQGWGKI